MSRLGLGAPTAPALPMLIERIAGGAAPGAFRLVPVLGRKPVRVP